MRIGCRQNDQYPRSNGCLRNCYEANDLHANRLRKYWSGDRSWFKLDLVLKGPRTQPQDQSNLTIEPALALCTISDPIHDTQEQ